MPLSSPLLSMQALPQFTCYTTSILKYSSNEKVWNIGMP